jgi:oligopeptide/dipeptide ABC transporter ATP-binding protein
MGEKEVLALEDVHKRFPVKSTFSRRGGAISAVSGVSLTIEKGDSFGLVGESGCGKTTLGRVAIRLLRANEGRVLFDGIDITAMSEKNLRPMRRRMQIIFQDPYSSLNPRMRVEFLIGEGMLIHNMVKRSGLKDAVAEVLKRVGLTPDTMYRYPHEFSGGQRQRVCIARAIALEPELIVADEPLSALDVSIQAQILNLLMDIRDDMGVSYLFISHDLRVVNLLCNKVAVMYFGEIVEIGDSDCIFNDSRHPYTKALLSAVPTPVPGMKGKKIVLSGDIPSPFAPPPGCSFHTRCPIADGICEKEEPLLRDVAGRLVSCHFA